MKEEQDAEPYEDEDQYEGGEEIKNAILDHTVTIKTYVDGRKCKLIQF